MRVTLNQRLRVLLGAAVVSVAMLAAPAAFARDHGRGHGHLGISIGFSGPGYSIGYSDFGHGRRGWGGSLYTGYAGYGGYGYGNYYRPSYYAPIVDRGYYYSYPAYYPTYYGPTYYGGYYGSYDSHRPVTRRVVHRTVRYYDRDDRDHRHRRHDGYRGDSYRNDRDYRRRDDAYGRGGGYYDRGG